MLDAIYRCSSVDWKPSPVVALATSVDESQVAAAREDGSLEIWLVSPGSVGWHCQLTIHGKPESRVSSLVWCRPGLGDAPSGRLLSSSIDGSVSEWDLFDLRQKIVLDSIGVSIWKMAAEPSNHTEQNTNQKHNTPPHENGYSGSLVNGRAAEVDSGESEEDEDEDDSVLNEEPASQSTSLALACDDGCVRIYKVYHSDKLTYYRSLPRVSGRVLSVTWSPDALRIYSGSSDGFIRCWDAKTAQEIYRITAGLGGLGSGPELCIWSLLALRCGTLVSADSTGSVQFWDSQHGTLQQAHSCHKGDVNALASSPSHNRVYSAGSDGQVILYKLSADAINSVDDTSFSNVKKKWVYVGYVRAHTHDVKALTVAVPICREDASPEEKIKKPRGRDKPLEFLYHKWAHLGVPMLISGGDDTKLYAYSVKEFTKFSPHDICPAPQRISIQLVQHPVYNTTPLLLVQSPHWLDILSVRLKNGTFSDVRFGPSGGTATTDLVARVKCGASRKIVCSAIASSGTFFAYSDHVKLCLFELKRSKADKQSWTINKRQLSADLPYAHCMVFSSDSSRLILAGHDRMIYVMDMGTAELIHAFTPCHTDIGDGLPPSEPPITRMFTSDDGQWLAAVNCFGDIYVFNLELQRQHWFLSRLDGAAITAGGFSPGNSNILIVTTSLNQVYALDVEAKGLGEWSMRHTFSLPRRYQEFPGEVIGLSFPPDSNSSSVVVYSPRAMCLIDFGMAVEKDDENRLTNGHDVSGKKLQNGNLKRKLKAFEVEMKPNARKNFEFCGFKDPVLFVGHLSKNALLIVDKPWMQVVRTFDAPPVHRHIYGT